MTTINELIDLKGRRALITGASGKLGRVMADTLAELGASLVLVDQSITELNNLNEDLFKRWGSEIDCQICDLEHQTQRSDLIRYVKQNGINILVNNAAFVGASEIQGWNEPFEKQTVETWRRGLEVNLTSIFDLCQGLAPMLKSQEGASIINSASIYGLYGPDWSLYEGTNMNNPAAYAASKGGLIQLTKWLATTIAPEVRVNAISPGGIFRNQSTIFVKRYEDKTPLGRMASEDDFRGAIAYLATDMSKYVTGQNFSVDGGWGVW